MKELFRLIYRIHFFLIFLILEIIAFSFLVNNNSYQRAKFFNSSEYVIGNIYSMYCNITDYILLRQENEQLLLENAMLHNKSGSDISINHEIVADSILLNKNKYIPARVINNSVKKHKNYITINKGENDSIEQEMGVISPSGIVGIVRFTSGNFASVVSVLNNTIQISTKIKRLGYFGPLAWSGGNTTEASLMEIPVHVPIVVGDTLVSSGYSAVFPEGILVGTIKEFHKKQGGNFYSIKVKLSVDYSKLGGVYIIKNKLKDEQIELEEKTIND